MSLTDLGTLLIVVLLLRTGQTLLLVGDVRSKNAAGVAVRCVLDLAVVTLTLWAIGGVFVPFGGIGVGGSNRWVAWDHLLGNGGPVPVVALLSMLVIATAAVLGATAERARMTPVLALSAALAVVLPMLFRVRFGWGGPEHAAETQAVLATVGAGAAALTMAARVGPRKGKFNRDQSVNFVPGHGLVFQLIGLLLLAAGWCALARGLDGLLALCAALLAGAGYGRVRFGKIDAGLMLVAGVGGLAAAGVLAVSPFASSAGFLAAGGGAAVIAGAVAGLATPAAVVLLETRFRVDDVAGFGSAYLCGGTAGVVVAALTRRPGTFGGYVTGLAGDAAFWLIALATGAALAYAVGRAFTGHLRVSEAVEFEGVDLAELDVNAYPDFQQTMIKSHHLRQL